MVHRPKYDDWSWAKGKLDPGEEYPVAATRETAEETGLDVHLGMPLPPASYTVLDRTGVPATKQVRYWAAEVVGGQGRLVNEIDEVAWLDVLTAHDRLDYARDRDQLRRGRPGRRRRSAHDLAAGGRPPRQGAPARLLDAAGPRTAPRRPR